MAESQGFEPWVQFSPHTRLAIVRLKPYSANSPRSANRGLITVSLDGHKISFSLTCLVRLKPYSANSPRLSEANPFFTTKAQRHKDNPKAKKHLNL